MTNFQLLLSIGVPSLLVVLSWVHNNTRLNRLEAAFDVLNRRVDDVHRRMDELQRTLHADMISFQAAIHADMLTFQASILGELSVMKERIAVLEVRR